MYYMIHTQKLPKYASDDRISNYRESEPIVADVNIRHLSFIKNMYYVIYIQKLPKHASGDGGRIPNHRKSSRVIFTY